VPQIFAGQNNTSRKNLKMPLEEEINQKLVLLPAVKTKTWFPFYKTKPCKFFAQNSCRYGSRCRFHHDKISDDFLRFKDWSELKLKEIIQIQNDFQANTEKKLDDILNNQLQIQMLLKHLSNTTKNSMPDENSEIIYLAEEITSHISISDTETIKTNERTVEIIPRDSSLSAKKRTPVFNISETKINHAFPYEEKCCGMCKKTASLRCSKCKAIYYCSQEHQIKHWKEHKKLCILATEDPQNVMKDFEPVTNSNADFLQVQIKKTDQPLGILLQFDEENEVLLINDIMNSKMSALQVGDQILQINEQKPSSVQDFIQILSLVDVGKYIQFKVKQRKETKG